MRTKPILLAAVISFCLTPGVSSQPAPYPPIPFHNACKMLGSSGIGFVCAQEGASCELGRGGPSGRCVTISNAGSDCLCIPSNGEEATFQGDVDPLTSETPLPTEAGSDVRPAEPEVCP